MDATSCFARRVIIGRNRGPIERQAPADVHPRGRCRRVQQADGPGRGGHDPRAVRPSRRHRRHHHVPSGPHREHRGRFGAGRVLERGGGGALRGRDPGGAQDPQRFAAGTSADAFPGRRQSRRRRGQERRSAGRRRQRGRAPGDDGRARRHLHLVVGLRPDHRQARPRLPGHRRAEPQEHLAADPRLSRVGRRARPCVRRRPRRRPPSGAARAQSDAMGRSAPSSWRRSAPRSRGRADGCASVRPNPRRRRRRRRRAPVLLPPRQRAAPAAVDANATRAQAEADAQRLRAEAEAAKRQADAELARARADAESSRAAKAKAEADAAAARLRAQAEADAARIRADAEAAAARTKSEAEAAARRRRPRPPRPRDAARASRRRPSRRRQERARGATGASRRFDGTWNVIIDCPEAHGRHLRLFTNEFVAQVKDGVLRGERGHRRRPELAPAPGRHPTRRQCEARREGPHGRPEIHRQGRAQQGSPYAGRRCRPISRARAGRVAALQLRPCDLTFVKQ